MYHDNSPDFVREEYYYKSKTISKCGRYVCIKGKMSTSHRAKINVKVYPKKAENLFTPKEPKGLTDDINSVLSIKHHRMGEELDHDLKKC